MVGLIIATSILGALFVASVVIGVIKYHELAIKQRSLEEKVNSIGNCLLTYIVHPEQIDIVEDLSSDGFSFPNSEGF